MEDKLLTILQLIETAAAAAARALAPGAGLAADLELGIRLLTILESLLPHAQGEASAQLQAAQTVYAKAGPGFTWHSGADRSK